MTVETSAMPVPDTARNPSVHVQDVGGSAWGKILGGKVEV